MDFYLVEQILRHMQIVPTQDDEASGRGVAQQGRDEDVRVDDQLQGPSPRPRRPPLPMLLPDALLYRLGDIFHGFVRELAAAQQGIEPTEVVELLRERLSGHLAPSDFGMLLHFFVELVRDAQGEIRHRDLYV